jgi:hypothetical protein
MPAFMLAISIPLVYGAYEIYTARKISFVVAIGLVSVALTGGIGIMRLDNRWLALKEAAVPLVIGLVLLAAKNTRYALVPGLLGQVIDWPRVRQAWVQGQPSHDLERLISIVTYLFASSFMLSAALNWGLAKFIVRSPAGTEAFNHELARLSLLSYPVIALPSMIVLMGTIGYFAYRVKKQTGLNWEDIMIKS